MAAATETLALELRGESGSISRTFMVTQLPPIRAYKLAARLARLFGPAIGPLLSAAGKGGLASLQGALNSPKGNLGAIDLDLSKLGETIKSLFLSLDDSEIEGLVRELLVTCTCNDGMQFIQMTVENFNALFAGDLAASLKLLVFAAKVNFADFFPMKGASLK